MQLCRLNGRTIQAAWLYSAPRIVSTAVVRLSPATTAAVGLPHGSGVTALSDQMCCKPASASLQSQSFVYVCCTVLTQDAIPNQICVLSAVMASHQAAVGKLKAALGSWAACLTEETYADLVKEGYDSPEVLLDAQPESLERILLHHGAVAAVRAWQEESKPEQHHGMWQCICHIGRQSMTCRHSPLLV